MVKTIVGGTLWCELVACSTALYVICKAYFVAHAALVVVLPQVSAGET